MTRRALLVASTGGHLEQLTRLEPRFHPAFTESVFVTFDDAQSKSLLHGRQVHHVPRIPPRGAKQAAAAMAPALRLLRQERVTDVISTGSAIAVPFLLAARALGVRAHYVESAARSEGPSLSGKILSKVAGVNLYCQYEQWADDRWHYGGSVFDSYYATQHHRPATTAHRVVVTLGTMRGYPFTAAISATRRVLAEIAAPDCDVLWQVGDTPVPDLATRDLIPARELREAIDAADLVVAHAGIGSCLQILDSGRAPVLLPRRRSMGEHIDDHQAMIAEELDRRRLAVSRQPEAFTEQTALEAMAIRVCRGSAEREFPLQAPDHETLAQSLRSS